VCESRNRRKLIGLVTDRDLASQVVAAGTLVKDVMSRDPFTCNPQDDLQKANDAMQSRQVR
jgi:CBS domain-containing protein